MKSNNLSNIDIWLNNNIFHNKKYGTYIEAGANDGVRDSITYFFSKNLNWSGFLIEPLAVMYNKCVTARRGDICLNFGLSDKDCTLKLKVPVDNLDNSSVVMSEEHEKCLIKSGYGKQFNEYNINCISYKTFIETYYIHSFRPDLFVLDVEGHENAVLRGMIETCQRRDFPQVLVVEHDWSNKDELKQILQHDYDLVKTFDHDFVFMLKS